MLVLPDRAGDDREPDRPDGSPQLVLGQQLDPWRQGERRPVDVLDEAALDLDEAALRRLEDGEVDDLRVTFVAPRGFIQYKDDGGTNPVSAKVRIEYRKVGASSWITLRNASGTEFKLVAERRFVKTGQARDDRVAIMEGLKADEEVVTTGQLKLNPGTAIRIDNAQPLIRPDARPKE